MSSTEHIFSLWCIGIDVTASGSQIKEPAIVPDEKARVKAPLFVMRDCGSLGVTVVMELRGVGGSI